MNAKHTPGPWSRNIPPARKYAAIFAGRNHHVAYVASRGMSDDEVEANCNLITAAPDMLEALKQADARWSDYGAADVKAAIKAAIAKATGAE